MTTIRSFFGSLISHRLCLFLFSACWLTTATAAPGGPGDLSVGVCKQDITPVSASLAQAYEDTFGEAKTVNHTDPIFMAGFGNNRQATGYHDRLWARGVVIDGRGGRIALVALDLVGYFNNQIEIAREMVGSDVDYLIVQSTHSHEGPDTLGIWGPDPLTTGVDAGYLDFVNDAIADCVNDATANLRAARVKSVTTSTAGLSTGMRSDDDGYGVADQKVLAGDDILSPETNGRIVDPNLVVLQFTEREAAKDVIATIVNFGSHPEALWSQNTLLTSDFPHFVRERLEQEYGGTAIWVSGALGVLQGPDRIDVTEDGVNPVLPRRSFQFAEVHGRQLAERAIAALDNRPGHPAPVVAFARENPVPVSLDNSFFRFFFAVGVLGQGRTLYTNGLPDASVGFPLPPPFDVIPQSLGDDLQTEVGAARVGDAGLIVVPTELDPQIGAQYRAAMTGVRDKLIVGLGNDHIGYQVLESKFDQSCMICAPFVLAGVPQFCPLYPDIDCSTVFQNNVGPGLDPAISGALMPLIEQINQTHP